ncbi:MAG: hypothetical protein WCG31_11250, partial [Deltaproteobacteria bacterium]
IMPDGPCPRTPREIKNQIPNIKTQGKIYKIVLMKAETSVETALTSTFFAWRSAKRDGSGIDGITVENCETSWKELFPADNCGSLTFVLNSPFTLVPLKLTLFIVSFANSSLKRL